MNTESLRAYWTGRRRKAAGALVLAVVIAVVYWPALGGKFIWDDELLITGNGAVKEAGGLGMIWRGEGSMDYTPLTLTSYWGEWRMWGANPAGYHVVNAGLHWAGTLLLWDVLEGLGVPWAFLGALLFAVHPVNAASVAWIAERKNTLSLVFYLAAVRWHLGYYKSGRMREYGLGLGAAACALLSKGSTAVLPAMLLMCVWWRNGRVTRRDWKLAAPYIALAGVMGLVTVRYQAQIVAAAVAREPAGVRIIRAGRAIWFYLWKDLMPMNLCAIYPKWRLDAADWREYVPALAAAACVAGLFAMRKRWGRGPLMAAGCFLVPLAPVLGFLNMGFMEQADVADWWQQIALMAPAAACGAALGSWRRGGGRAGRLAAPAVAALAVALLAAATRREAEGYRTAEIYWRRVLERNPESWGAHADLGRQLSAEGRTREAETEYREAVRLNPGSGASYLGLGNALREEGDERGAEEAYRKGLEADPEGRDAAGIHKSLGVTLETDGKRSEALKEYEEAERLAPGDAGAHVDAGLVYAKEKKWDEAMAEYGKAVELRPDDAATHFDMGNALEAQGKEHEAMAEYQNALELRPGYAEAHNNLGNALRAAGRPEDAAAEYAEALRLEPRSANAAMNLGTILLAEGKAQEGAGWFRKAVEAEPESDQAQWNLGGALLETGAVKEALEHLDLAVRLNKAGAEAFIELGALLEKHGLYKEAAQRYVEGAERYPEAPEVWNDAAWLLATCPDGAVRDGKRAVELAMRANAETGGGNPAVLGTLAAAYAECGRYDEAVATARRALEVAGGGSEAAELKAAVEHYERGEPLRRE